MRAQTDNELRFPLRTDGGVRWARGERGNGLRASLTALALSLSGPAWGLGLGEIELQSALGQPLKAVVRLTGGTSAPLDASCFDVSGQTDGSGLPAIRRARIDVRADGADAVLVLTTAERVVHPAVALNLHLTCGTDLLRQYVLLLDPPALNLPVTASAAASQQPWQARAADPPRAQPRVHGGNTVKSAKVRRASAPSRARDIVPAERTADAPRHRSLPDKHDQLALSRADDDLKLAVELGQAGRASELTQSDRDLARTERLLLRALEETVVQDLTLSDKVRRMEAFVATLRAEVAKIDTEIRARQADLADTPPVGAAPPSAPASPATVPAPVVTPAVAVPAAQPVSAAAASPASQTMARPTTPTPTPGNPIWDWLLFLALAAGSALALHRFTRKPVQQSPGAIPANIPEPSPSHARALDVLLVTPEDEYQETVRIQRPLIEAAAEAEPSHEYDTLAQPAPIEPRPPELSEQDSAMELAEIMLSFGRVKGAAQTLADFIAANPRQAVEPWIKLLDVYRGAGMRQEWDVLAERLNKAFNVEIMRWDGNSDSPAPRMLEQYPHIVARLTELWPGPRAAEFLRDLLSDNRSGTRAGFPVEVMSEILILLKVLEAERPVPSLEESLVRLNRPEPRRAVG